MTKLGYYYKGYYYNILFFKMPALLYRIFVEIYGYLNIDF